MQSQKKLNANFQSNRNKNSLILVIHKQGSK